MCCQGNHNVAKSPDEYTIQMEAGRGMKEFQFDQIFMPDSTQEKVFEDTNVSSRFAWSLLTAISQLSTVKP